MLLCTWIIVECKCNIYMCWKLPQIYQNISFIAVVWNQTSEVIKSQKLDFLSKGRNVSSFNESHSPENSKTAR